MSSFRDLKNVALIDCLSSADPFSLKNRDGERKADQQRPIFLKSGVISGADGSAYMEVGDTKVTCTVHGPHELDRSNDTPVSNIDLKAAFTGKVHFAPFASKIRLQRNNKKDQQTEQEVRMSRALTQAFMLAVRLEQYPKSQIDAYVNVLEDDGAVLATAITCCTLAFIDAGIELYDVVIGSCCRVADDTILLDSSSREENCTDSGATIALLPSLNQISLNYYDGEMQLQLLPKLLKMLNENCYAVYPVVQEASIQALKKKS